MDKQNSYTRWLIFNDDICLNTIVLAPTEKSALRKFIKLRGMEDWGGTKPPTIKTYSAGSGGLIAARIDEDKRLWWGELDAGVLEDETEMEII